jgi:hypothetical protein
MPAKWQQWMPLYVDRWRGSPAVRAMHPAARSGYLELLLEQWQTEECALSTDPLTLAEKSGLGTKLWRAYGETILRNFITVTVSITEMYRNESLHKEWLAASRIHEARRNAAQATNTVRKPRRSPLGKEDGENTVTARSQAHTNSPLQEQSVTATGTRGEEPPTPITVTVELEPETSSIPEGLSSLQYAHFVLENAAIAAGHQMRLKMADAIDLLAKSERVKKSIATERMLERVLASQARGETVNGFWIEDGKWKPTATKADIEREAFLAGGQDAQTVNLNAAL